MKIKVLKSFADKHTKESYEVGQIVELTKERYAEIKRTASFNIQFEEVEDVNLESLNKEDLVKHAKEEKEIDLDMDMTKKEMIEKIEE